MELRSYCPRLSKAGSSANFIPTSGQSAAKSSPNGVLIFNDEQSHSDSYAKGMPNQVRAKVLRW